MPSARSESTLLAPLPLRLVLALTFIWAGWGKIEATMPVKGDDAARLANIGVIRPVAPAPGASPGSPTAPLPTPGQPGTRGPDGRETQVQVALVQVAPVQILLAQNAAPVGVRYSAVDFPEDIRVKRLWGIALRVSKAGQPGVDATGTPRPAVWPAFLSDGLPARFQAQSVMTVEILCGVFLLVGFMTRLSGFALAGVMLGAIWLDQLGPAVQSGSTVLGVLPAYDRWDVRAWMPLMWQSAVLAGCLTLVLLGPGRLSLDWAMTARRVVVVRTAPPAAAASVAPAASPVGRSPGA